MLFGGEVMTRPNWASVLILDKRNYLSAIQQALDDDMRTLEALRMMTAIPEFKAKRPGGKRD